MKALVFGAGNIGAPASVRTDVQAGHESDFRCPNCGSKIPRNAFLAILEKAARGEHAECDYCPY